MNGAIDAGVLKPLSSLIVSPNEDLQCLAIRALRNFSANGNTLNVHLAIHVYLYSKVNITFI